MLSLRKSLFPLLIGFLAWIGLASCSSHEDSVRMPADFEGIWSPSDSVYLEFGSDFTVHKLEIEHQDGESIGWWTNDAYIYEPGYHIVIYMMASKADVYQVIDLTQDVMTWCWVEEIQIEETSGKEQIGKLLGDIIKQAQEGFNLNPELYQSFRRISKDDFFSLLEEMDIMYPWF